MPHRLTITLPDKIYNQISKRAKESLRSISNQIIYELTNPTTPQFIPHDTPGGMPTQPTYPQPPFEPTATTTTKPKKISIIGDDYVPYVPPEEETRPFTIKEELARRAAQIKEESPEPITKPRKFQRPDGEPFTIEDFEKYLPEGTVSDDTYRTLKKKIPSLQFITILREGASRPLDDFVKYLKEEYQYTLENALDYSPAQTMPSATLKALAGYLQPHIP